MLIENEFTVSADPSRLWEILNDVEVIAPCMPGAELAEVVDDRTWRGRVHVKFGPIAMTFSGTVTVEERDDSALRVRMHARGTELKGKGAANAVVTSWLEGGQDGYTLVKMQADVTLTGAAAQLSRGLLPEISRQLTQQFADCLHERIDTDATAGTATAAGAPGGAAPAPAAKPVGGIRLGLTAIASLLARWIKRLFGRRSS